MSWTREQLEAITTAERMVCVDAGAGSGKTGVLIERIIHLIKNHGVALDEIVAITFTDAAAAEMKDRLRRAFRSMAPRDDALEMSRWRALERQVDGARLSTIHSFCTGLLRENALRIGLDPDFSVLAEAETILLRQETVTDAVHALLEKRDGAAVRAATELGTSRLINEMIAMLKRRRLIEYARATQPQTDAADLARHWQELADRVLVQQAHDPKVSEWRAALDGLGECCMNDADAREGIRRQMMAMLDAMMAVDVSPLGPPRMRGGGSEDSRSVEEQHALADKIRQLAAVVGSVDFRKGSAKSWSSDDDLSRLKEIQKEVREFASQTCFKPLESDIESRAAQITLDLLETYDNIKDAFQRAKLDRACLDFDDLIGTALATLRNNDEVRARTAARFKHLLIDEFQDTDSSQLEIARLLADHPGGPALFIVGDAKQSIYDFRDAEVEIFQAEKQRAARVIPLAKNFRTVPEVLGLANDLFEQSGLLDAVEPQYTPLQTAIPAVDECRVEFLIPEEEDDTDAYGYRAREAEMIAARLDQMCRGEARVQVWDKRQSASRPAEFGDAAILFRSTSNQYIYEESLRKRQIPYVVVAGRGFYERQEVVDMRNLLAVLVDPWDEMALLGFLRGPMAGLCDDALVMLCGHGGLAQAFHGDAHIDGEMGQRLADARHLVAGLRAHMEMPLAAFLRYVLDRTAYEAIVLSQFLGLQKAYNVRKMVDLADDFGKIRPPKLAAFVHYLDEVATDEMREGEAVLTSAGTGAVTLMSIHKSKGLEFPIVVLPDLSRGQGEKDRNNAVIHRELGIATKATDNWGERAKPAIYLAIDQARNVKREAEDARVLYVALTRARDWLLLAGAPKPKEGTWLNMFGEHFGVLDRADGDMVEGRGWRGIVRRKAMPVPQTSQLQDTSEAAFDGVETRVGPIAVQSVRRTFSVSELLDRMHPSPVRAASSNGARTDLNKAMLRGTLVHRLFEVWDLDSPPPLVELLDEAGCSARDRVDFEKALREAAEVFQKSELRNSFITNKESIRREIPFVLRFGDALVSGTVDAVLPDGCIVDYKTGRPSAQSQDQHAHQLRLYAAAMERLTGQAPPRAVVYYTTTGDTKEVDVSGAAIEATLALAEDAIAALQTGVSP